MSFVQSLIRPARSQQYYEISLEGQRILQHSYHTVRERPHVKLHSSLHMFRNAEIWGEQTGSAGDHSEQASRSE